MSKTTKKRWPYNRRVMVPIDDIIVPKERVSSVFDPAMEEEFTESIKAGGIKKELDIMDIEGTLYLVDGLHRIQVAEKLGLKEVPCIIKKGTIEDLLIVNIISARQRGKSNPAQEAEVLALLERKRGMPLETAAKMLGMSEAWARKLILIADLPDELKDLVKHGKIPVLGAFHLAHIGDPSTQMSVARDAEHFGYSVEQIRAAVIKAINPDYEPLPGEYEIILGQAPVRVPIPCGWCGRPMDPKTAPYVWTCSECQDLLRDFKREWDRSLTADTTKQTEPQQKPAPP